MTVPHVLSRRAKLPTQERGERRVADLLGAAEEHFGTFGYEATTMSAIAEHAGASIGSLYQFFPNKESIGSALLTRYLEGLTERLAAWKADLPSTVRSFGEMLISVVVDYVLERPACRVLVETPSLFSWSYGMDNLEKLAGSVQDLLATYAPTRKDVELAKIALAVSFMIRATVQASRTGDRRNDAALRMEMQRALGSYLEERLTVVATSGGGSQNR
jgi:AcrR family transcriptional regulator